MPIVRADDWSPCRLESDVSALFEPFTLRDVTIPNRVWMPPMCQYSAAPQGPGTGVPDDWHFAHYAARAAGGTGLIIVEATGVGPEGRITPYDLGIWNDTQVEAFRRITRFLVAQGTVPAIQLAHAGRKASTDRPWKGGAPVGPDAHGWQPVAPRDTCTVTCPVPRGGTRRRRSNSPVDPARSRSPTGTRCRAS